jgi:hypothetical protein
LLRLTKANLRLILVLLSFLLVLVSGLYLFDAGTYGVRLNYFLSRDASGPQVLRHGADRLGFHRAKPLPFYPKGGDFSIKINGHLYPPRPGNYRLALVSLGSAELRIGSQSYKLPSLHQVAWPDGYLASSSPQGQTRLMRDRDLATRWTSGRAKRLGDWIKVKLPRTEQVHGVVLDSAPSGMRDCPLRFGVRLKTADGDWEPVADVDVPGMKASTVDAMFAPMKADEIQITLLAEHGSFWWSVHELHLITDQVLDSMAVQVSLDRDTAISLTHRPPPEETKGAPGYIKRDYGLLRLYWKPPGQDWEPVPAWALGAKSNRLLPGWITALIQPMGRLLPWLWAGLAALWIALLWPGQSGPDRWAGSFSPDSHHKLVLSAGILLLIGSLDDLAGFSGIFRFWTTLIYGPVVQPSLWQIACWTAGALGLVAISTLLLHRARPGPGRNRNLFPWALAALVMIQAGLTITWLQSLGLTWPLVNNDHGCFQYAHSIWQNTLAPLIHYNPFWNAGILEWEPVRSGSFAAFLLARPLTWFLPISKAYTLFTPIIFALLLPWIGFASLRGFGAGRTSSLLAALILIMPPHQLGVLAFHGGQFRPDLSRHDPARPVLFLAPAGWPGPLVAQCSARGGGL